MNGKTNVTVSAGNDSLGGIIPLNPPTTFVVTADNAKCLLTWTDPLDKYADDLGQITDEGDQLVSQFAFTRIVRKEGGYPGTPDDGVTVTESSVRNQYQSSVYTDEGLTNNTTYYYAAFTCNTDGVWSGSTTESATPVEYDPILGNNTWEQVRDVVNQGISQSLWAIGDEININILGVDTPFVILDFNHDNLADGSGKGDITFGIKDITTQIVDMAPVTGSVEEYPYTNGHQWLITTVYNSLDPILRGCIKNVSKVYQRKLRNSGGSSFNYLDDGHQFDTTLFMLGPREMGYSVSDWNFSIDSGEFKDGVIYPYYSTAQNRIKSDTYWLRLYGKTDNYYYAYIYYGTMGDSAFTQASWQYFGFEDHVNFAFCIGKTSA